MKRALVGSLAAVAAALLAAPAGAQIIPNLTPFSAEVRGFAALPQGGFQDEGSADTGIGFGGEVTFHFMPMFGLYGAYSRTEFALDAGDLTDEGFDVGLRVEVPTPLIPIDPWIRGGAVFHRVQTEGTAEDFESDFGTGFEVGAGLGLSFLPKISITPQASYTAFSYEADSEGDEVDVTYLRVGIGLRIRI